MQNSLLFPILLQVTLIALNAVFVCAEIAIVSLNDNKLALLVSQGNKKALRLARLTSRPARFLATIQIVITLSGFLGSAFAADNFSDRLVGLLVSLGVSIPVATLDTIAVVVITLILSFFTLVFGELVPKRIGMKKAEPLALALSGLIAGIARIFAPVVAILTVTTNLVLRLIGIDPNVEEEAVSEEEIKMMVDRGSEKGVFDSDTKEFITNIFEFDDTTVGEFATHRTELDLLRTHQTPEQWRQIILSTLHTRYPVCGDTIDDVVGILDARAFFAVEDPSIPALLETVVKPAYFVPETLKADVLFKQMRASHRYYAVVLDEHGGFLGVVTIRDLLEQLVGDLDMDGEGPDLEELEEGLWRVRGSAPLDDVARSLGVKLPLEEYETFGGYVFSLYGSIPPDGKRVFLQTDRLKIQVDRIHNHKLEEATVRVLPSS